MMALLPAACGRDGWQAMMRLRAVSPCHLMAGPEAILLRLI
jgi:hypothetical protein